MWKWDLTLGNRWARVAKCWQLLNIPVKIAGDASEERRGTSWARATRELRRLKHRIEAVGGSKDQWEAGVWHMDKEQWDLIWSGEQAFLKTVPHLLAAGHYTAEELTEPRRSSTGQPYKIPGLMTAQEGERTQTMVGNQSKHRRLYTKAGGRSEPAISSSRLGSAAGKKILGV
jgi:hypothetical protein